MLARMLSTSVDHNMAAELGRPRRGPPPFCQTSCETVLSLELILSPTGARTGTRHDVGHDKRWWRGRRVVGFMSASQLHPDMICEVFVFASTDLVSGDELRD